MSIDKWKDKWPKRGVGAFCIEADWSAGLGWRACSKQSRLSNATSPGSGRPSRWRRAPRKSRSVQRFPASGLCDLVQAAESRYAPTLPVNQAANGEAAAVKGFLRRILLFPMSGKKRGGCTHGLFCEVAGLRCHRGESFRGAVKCARLARRADLK